MTGKPAPVPTDVPGVREAARNVVMLYDAGEPLYHEDIEPLRAALAASPDAPRVAGLDVERLEQVFRDAGARLHENTWHVHTDDLAAILARLSDIGDTAVPPTSTEDDRG